MFVPQTIRSVERRSPKREVFGVQVSAWHAAFPESAAEVLDESGRSAGEYVRLRGEPGDALGDGCRGESSVGAREDRVDLQVGQPGGGVLDLGEVDRVGGGGHGVEQVDVGGVGGAGVASQLRNGEMPTPPPTQI